MGMLSASGTVVRLHAPLPAKIDREAVARAVGRRVFREADPEADGAAPSYGWVAVHDPLRTDLDVADLFFHHYLLVGFRYDRRAIPAKLRFLERRRAEAERKQALGRDRLGRVLRQEIRAEVEARLLARALPTPRLFDCAWNLDTGRVYFSGKARAPREAFQELFRETFGVGPMPMIPYVTVEHLGLAPRAVESVRAVEPARLVADSEEASAVPHLPFEEAAP